MWRAAAHGVMTNDGGSAGAVEIQQGTTGRCFLNNVLVESSDVVVCRVIRACQLLSYRSRPRLQIDSVCLCLCLVRTNARLSGALTTGFKPVHKSIGADR